MEEQRFDDLARLVAQKTSRRQVLKVLAGAAVGGIFAERLSPAWASSTRSQCAQFCNATFGKDTPATSQCLKDGKSNPNALCNSACNGGSGTLCGSTSGGHYTSYSSTTCCTSGHSCDSSTYTCSVCPTGQVACTYAASGAFSGGTVCCASGETCYGGYCTCNLNNSYVCATGYCPEGTGCYNGICYPGCS
jgi:hypothetical protein